jgi:hypothetical protein
MLIDGERIRESRGRMQRAFGIPERLKHWCDAVPLSESGEFPTYKLRGLRSSSKTSRYPQGVDANTRGELRLFVHVGTAQRNLLDAIGARKTLGFWQVDSSFCPEFR